eukprot:Skav235475  [mRNA]  locus=scaffold1269:227861:237789:+ [translate_table: standard]
MDLVGQGHLCLSLAGAAPGTGEFRSGPPWCPPDSECVGALRLLGRLHQRQCHWSQAAGCFHRLIAVDPSNDEWPAQLQVCLDQLELKDGVGQGRAFSFDTTEALAASHCARGSSATASGQPALPGPSRQGKFEDV